MANPDLAKLPCGLTRGQMKSLLADYLQVSDERGKLNSYSGRIEVAGMIIDAFSVSPDEAIKQWSEFIKEKGEDSETVLDKSDS